MLAYFAMMSWFSGLYSKNQYWVIALCLLTYGVFVEFMQSFTPYRYLEFMDVVADLIGIGIGWLAALLGLRNWPVWTEKLLLAIILRKTS